MPREVFGLLGPNGSGKSTTIKMILGLLHPTRGRLMVFGKPPTDVGIKRRIGYLPEESYLYPFLNARETLDYYGKIFELDRRIRRQRIEELLDMVGLLAAQYRPVREYSKGMQRRIGLAQALINDPDLLILDEPTAGLDPIGTRQVKDLIVGLGRRGKTVLLSSHLLSDVEDVVGRMIILYGGKKRKEGTCDDLLVSRARTTLELDALDDDTIAEIDRLVHRRNAGSLLRVAHPRQRLEDLFLDIVELARAERIETSGVTHAGRTAAFLRGEQPQGEELIEALLEHEEPVEALPDAAQTEASRIEPDKPDQDAIEALVAHDEEPEPAGSAESGGLAGAEPRSDDRARPEDVDLDVIGSLLDPGDDEGEPPEQSR